MPHGYTDLQKNLNTLAVIAFADKMEQKSIQNRSFGKQKNLPRGYRFFPLP